jgi:hypothetical protein
MSSRITVTRDELKELVREGVAEAFRDVGIIAGEDADVMNRRKDFQFLHDLRTTSESTKAKVGSAFLLAAASGLVWLIMSGLRLWTKQ